MPGTVGREVNRMDSMTSECLLPVSPKGGHKNVIEILEKPSWVLREKERGKRKTGQIPLEDLDILCREDLGR